MKGQTLIEILIALGIGGVIISAITVVITSGLNNAQFGKNQNLATNFAQEGMEVVRKIRNNNYNGFRAYSGTYCLGKNQTALGSPVTSCSGENVDAFIRSVQVQQNAGCSANGARVTVTVSWSDGKCPANNTYCHKSQLVSCLSAVNPIQGP